MNQLQIIVHDNRRVLTTSQIAESYGTDEKLVQQNFSNNKGRYKEGKHFFLLQGSELKTFKDQFENLGLVKKNASSLYLWTEKGAWLHAKSLNTDKAWDSYEMLVDEYYKVIEQTNQQDPIELALQTSLKNYKEIKSIKGDVEYLKDHMRIDGAQEYALNSQGKAKVFEVLGGYNSLAYNEVSRKAFGELWRDFKRHFQLPRYSELPKTKFDDAVYFISKWRPSTSLEIEIESYNNQTHLKLVK
ncbi:ORF6C domain-containing protein [Lysinibacillus sphaericus]|uniref:ORF6C domain-containing protein n=1 Tax=Lysinibacillus sphaericus TaxID=1421 RepID=UPI0004DF18A7|nr:ORF6C domain-containing protein [Lysinibacillus sphaericus]QPA60652.1 ORF6C domain-containing protein [Lysinibacillus sphaericus]